MYIGHKQKFLLMSLSILMALFPFAANTYSGIFENLVPDSVKKSGARFCYAKISSCFINLYACNFRVTASGF